MLQETRRIERNLVSKLNCMYFAARKVSVPSIEFMKKKEAELEESGEDPSQLLLQFSRRLNDLINLYFSADKNGKFQP